jgi:hypothetical protein
MSPPAAGGRRRGPPRRPRRAALAAAAVCLLAAARAASAVPPAPPPALVDALRTTGPASVHDAGSFGGVQHFTLPIGQGQGTCPPAALHGFAKCLRLPGGGAAWRVIVAWARVDMARLANVAEDLSAFGPYQCEPPAFYLQPGPGGPIPGGGYSDSSDTGGGGGGGSGAWDEALLETFADGSGGTARGLPLRVHEKGGTAFFPLALAACVPPGAPSEAFALRVAGSDYMAVLDAGACATPADPLVALCDPTCGGGSGGGREGGAGQGGGAGDRGGSELGPGGASGGGQRAPAPAPGAAGAGAPAAPPFPPAERPTARPAAAPAAAPIGAPAAPARRALLLAAAPGAPGSGDAASGACALRLAPGRLPATNLVLASVPPPWNEDLGSHIVRLRSHLQYHQATVGFAGHILYYDPAQTRRLLAAPAFRELLASYRVALVRWAAFPRVSWLPWDAQGLRLSHAFLALWGADAGVLPVDLDEYLLLAGAPVRPAAGAWSAPAASPPPAAALRALLARCGGGGRAGGVTFERFAALCGAACPGGDERPLWAPPGAGGAAPEGGPLAGYDWIEAAPHDGAKTWGTAACVYPASVHEVRPSGLPGCGFTRARPGCGRLVHLINAYARRAEAPGAPGRAALLPLRHPWWPRSGVTGGARGAAAAAAAAGEL